MHSAFELLRLRVSNRAASSGRWQLCMSNGAESLNEFGYLPVDDDGRQGFRFETSPLFINSKVKTQQKGHMDVKDVPVLCYQAP